MRERASGGSRRGGRLRAVAAVAFGVTAPVGLLASATVQVESTGAVPGDEFYAAGLLYAALGWLVPLTRMLGAVTGLLHGLAGRANSGVVRLALLVSGLALAVGPWTSMAWCVVTASVAWMICQLASRHRSVGARRDRPVEAALNVSWGRLLSWWLPLSFLCAGAAWIVTWSESLVYTGTFAPELFTLDDLAQFRALLPAIALHFGVIAATILLFPIALFKVGILLFGRRMTAGHHSTWAALTVVGMLGFFLHESSMALVGDEIRETGAHPEAIAAIGLLILYWFHVVESRFRGLPDDPGLKERSSARAWSVAGTAVLWTPNGWWPAPVRAWFHRHEWAFFVAHGLGAAMVIGILAKTSYPDLEDFRSYFITICVLVAVYVAALGLLALSQLFWSPLSRSVRIGSLVVMSVVAVWLGWMGFQPIASTPAMILHEYSRFGFIVEEGSLRSVVLPDNRIGFEEPTALAAVAEDVPPNRVPLGSKHFTEKLPPILFVLWDAGRPDRMGSYGYERPTTPQTDALAADSVVFDRAYSMATATTCSVRHTFTGQYSTRFMLTKDHHPFFVHMLRRVGYSKFFITALGSDYNGVSIEAFQRNWPEGNPNDGSFVNLGRHPKGLDIEAPDWHKTHGVLDAWQGALDEKGPEALYGTFTFLHLTGTHFPWGTYKPERRFGERPEDLYDGEVLKVDALTGELLDLLREAGVYDDAVIALFSDHGTGLLDHGRYGGFLPYEEQIRVPLLLKVPGMAPGRSDAMVGLIDLVPTVLDLLIGAVPGHYDGVSLRPLLDRTQPDLDRDYLVSLCAFEDAYALLEGKRWKLHYHRSQDYAVLFDLLEDPRERRNVYDDHPEVAKRLEGKLETFLWRGRGTYGNPYHYSIWPKRPSSGFP